MASSSKCRLSEKIPHSVGFLHNQILHSEESTYHLAVNWFQSKYETVCIMKYMSLKCLQSSSFCNFYSDWNFSFQFNFKFLRLKEINEDFPLLVCLNSTIWRIWNESWIFLKLKVFRENFSLCMFFSATKSYNLRNLNLNWKRPLPQIEGYQRKLLIL